MMCFMGLVFAGIGSCDLWDEECPPERDIIRYTIIGLMVVALLTNIFTMYIVCTYGSYFGVVMRRGRRGRMVMSIDTANVSVNRPGTLATNSFGLTGGMNNSRMQQLERENELLQRQLELQRQLNQQNQQGGMYPPPPPPNYGFSQGTAYPPPPSFPEPGAPPPPYSSIK